MNTGNSEMVAIALTTPTGVYQPAPSILPETLPLLILALTMPSFSNRVIIGRKQS
jgi:hypothetical protein